MSAAAVPPDAAAPDYGPAALARDLGVSREILARMEIHAALLRQWQPKINLVGPATMPRLWQRHFLDSGQLFRFLPPPAADAVVLDMGAGAGFPGLVLAAMGAGHVHLVEADGRKATFLRTAAREMGLRSRVTVHDQRLEALPAFAVDVITSRALAPLPQLLAWGLKFARPDSLWLFPKGRQVEDELTAARACWKMKASRQASLADPSGCVLLISEVEADGP